jgi:tetratricopeptide (TPR) repeat protein
LARARKDFEQAVRLDPHLFSAWQNLGRACQSLPDAADCAANAWRRVLALEPSDAEARFSMAALDERGKRYQESMRELDMLPAEELARPQAQVLYCADLVALGRYEEALQAARRAADSREYSAADVRWLLPRLETPAAGPVLAIFVEGLAKRGEATIDERRRLVTAYESMERWADARAALEALAAEEPRSTDHLFELARVAYKQHDLEGAVGYLGHARDLAPKDARVHFLFGLIVEELNLPMAARESLEKAVALAPENVDYRYALGLVNLHFQNPTAAVDCFQRYLQARPGDVRGRFALGVAYFQTNEFEEAAKLLRGVLDEPGAETGAAYYLGRMARMDQKTDEAAALLERSIRAYPSFAQAYTELARVRLEQGREADAQAALDQALKLAPDDFQANNLQLTLYHRTHDPRAAALTTRLRTLDERRSKESQLMFRGIEVKPY